MLATTTTSSHHHHAHHQHHHQDLKHYGCHRHHVLAKKLRSGMHLSLLGKKTSPCTRDAPHLVTKMAMMTPEVAKMTFTVMMTEAVTVTLLMTMTKTVT